MLTRKKAAEFIKILAHEHPEPTTELNFVTPYTLLVATILSAQATDVGVNKATKPLFEIVQTPQQMLDLGEDALKGYIKTIGLFNGKAKNIIAGAQILVDHYQGEIPTTRDELEALPGVGRKTANVVLNVAFGLPTIAVDTHIFRVSNRTGLAPGKNPLVVEEKLLQQVPQAFLGQAHHLLILHGRYRCKARTPLCQGCPVFHLCAYKEKRHD